jgi:hypothetical protein
MKQALLPVNRADPAGQPSSGISLRACMSTKSLVASCCPALYTMIPLSRWRLALPLARCLALRLLCKFSCTGYQSRKEFLNDVRTRYNESRTPVHFSQAHLGGAGASGRAPAPTRHAPRAEYLQVHRPSRMHGHGHGPWPRTMRMAQRNSQHHTTHRKQPAMSQPRCLTRRSASRSGIQFRGSWTWSLGITNPAHQRPVTVVHVEMVCMYMHM